MKTIFEGKIIAVTGGTGSIGSAIVRRLLTMKPKEVRIFARNEHKHWLLEKELEDLHDHRMFRHIIGDVRDKERLRAAIQGADIVIHAAGLKHIPFAEQNPEEAITINVEGSRHVLASALEYGVKKLVAISTDKAVDPTSMMGASKLVMERLFTADHSAAFPGTKIAVVRFGNVLNSMGSVLPRWKEQLQAGHPISVTDKRMYRFFMSLDDAVDLVLTACTILEGREIIVRKAPEMNIYKLAQKTLREYGADRPSKIVITGMRGREKLRESLFTDEEKPLLIRRGNLLIIQPDKATYNSRKNHYA